MCGIFGYLGQTQPGLLEKMGQSIVHRGPDGFGAIDAAPFHLGNQRLAVIDPANGKQPIYTQDKRFGIVYNGEIYNTAHLRQQLFEEGASFQSQCDTEIILQGYAYWGEAIFNELDGMFAVAIYDRQLERVILARDPVGIKPLFYWHQDNTFVFGSEIKALLCHPMVEAQLEESALHLLMNVRFVPGPRTLFKNILQCPPGTLIELTNSSAQLKPYHKWSFSQRSSMSLEEAGEQFVHLLDEAVSDQLVSDVPLGLYLSGGLDSSGICSSASQKNRSLEAFSLGFGEPTDEIADAQIAADHFGIHLNSNTIAHDPLTQYPRLIYFNEVPKVNAMQGYALASFAKESVTVTLSGLGGDELFMGYDLYDYLWPGRSLIDGGLGQLSKTFSKVPNLLARLASSSFGPSFENKRRAIELLGSGKDASHYYTVLRNGWDGGAKNLKEVYQSDFISRLSLNTAEAFAPYFDQPDLPFMEQVQLAEFRAKMVDDFLWNEDRMSMAHSLECRVPFLSKQLITFALSLPLNLKYHQSNKKAVMKAGLRKHLPQQLIDKKKWGFTVNPYYQFQKDLARVCQVELNESFLREQGIFNPKFVKKILAHPPSEKLRWHYFMLWQILGVKFWQEIFIQGQPWQSIEKRLQELSNG